jgi:hypothetical protein
LNSILSQVTSGVSRMGLRMVVVGQEKMGKTTFCAGAPGALLVPLEVGYAGVNVNKTPMLQTYLEVLQLVGELHQLAAQAYQAKQALPFRTVIFDSATALERMIHERVLALDAGRSKTSTMEAAHGGYGKAYNIANTLFNDLLGELDKLSVWYGINIVFTCHVFSSVVKDPNSGEYNSWDLLLHSPKNEKTYGKREMITQWADVIGFIYEPVFLSTAEGSKMTRAVSANKGRVMAISRTPAYVAGNRFGMLGELPLPAPPQNAWNVLAQALHATTGIDIFTR